MAELKKCRACGVDVQSNAPFGHCPKCLLELGLDAVPDDTVESADDSVTVAPLVNPAATAPVTEAPGDYIDRYKLLQKIGEGGCGVVYMAEQEEPIRRRVALKVIKPGMDTRSVIARFEAERQALAMMDHPNIAKVLDAGQTATGRPFFVMELVKGVRITEYCDQTNLPTRERLALFTQVCQAIQHAHQKGIIHRDIKPSNILVTLHDGVPVPKVIDFGIAKAMHQQRLTDLTLFTAFGQFIGTPAYMSPEQAEISGLDIDTRCDIYALGVLLYELLVGRTPFDSKQLLQAGLDEMRRIIMEQEPAKPSTRLSAMAGDDLATVAKQRQAEPPKLISLVRGDLDWIVMKCLEKDRTRRYETSSGLAADIQRHLDNEAVNARPPATAYRVQKFVRRNQGLVAATLTIAIVLLLSVLISAWQWRGAEQARFDATQRADAETRAKVKAEEAQRAEALALAKQREALAAETEQRKRAEYESYVAKIALAAAKIEGREFAAAEELLDTCPPLYRHWEWGRLKRLCHAELATIKGTGRIEEVKLSPDGRNIFTFDGGNCNIWDPTTSKKVTTFNWNDRVVRENLDWIREIFFLRESRRALLVSWSARLGSLCDLEKGAKLCQLDLAGFNYVHCAALSPDDRRILVGGQEPFVKLFDAQSGKELLKLTVLGAEMPANLGKSVHTVAFSPDGQRLLTGASYGIQLWDGTTGREIHRLNDSDGVTGRKSMNQNSIQRAMFSPDGKHIIGAGPETIRIWDTETGQEEARPGGSRQRLSLLLLSQSGRRALTSTLASPGRLLKLWDLPTWTNISTLAEVFGETRAAAFSPDDRHMLTVANDGIVCVWDVATGTNVSRLKGHRGTVNSAVFSANGKHVLTASDDRTACVWEMETGKELMIFSGHSEPVTAAFFCPGGERIATTSKDKSAKVWSLDASGQDLQLSVPGYTLTTASFSPNEKRILTREVAAQGGSRSARLWDAETGLELRRFQLPQVAVQFAAFTPDGRIALLKGWKRGPIDGSGPYQVIGLWEVESGKPITIVSEVTNAWDVVDVSPDAQLLFLARGTNAGIWDARTGKRVCTLEGFKHQLNRATFSPDGRHLMTKFGYGSDGSDPAVEAVRSQLERKKEFPYAKIWETSTGKQVCAINFYPGDLKNPVFTPDSKRLFTFGFSTCHVWDPENCTLQEFEAHNGIVSQDSKSFFGTKYDGIICVIDFESGRVRVSGKGHREDAQVTSVSSDGKRLLTSSIDGTAKLWDAETGRELFSFKTTIGRHSFPTFSPDDRQIIITSAGIATLLGTTEWK